MGDLTLGFLTPIFNMLFLVIFHRLIKPRWGWLGTSKPATSFDHNNPIEIFTVLQLFLLGIILSFWMPLASYMVRWIDEVYIRVALEIARRGKIWEQRPLSSGNAETVFVKFISQKVIKTLENDTAYNCLGTIFNMEMYGVTVKASSRLCGDGKWRSKERECRAQQLSIYRIQSRHAQRS